MHLYEIWGRNGRGPSAMYVHQFAAETERAAVEGYAKERRRVITAVLHVRRACTWVWSASAAENILRYNQGSTHQWRFDEQGLAHRVN